MQVFILSKGRAKSISTHRLFGNWDYHVVVHDHQEYVDYLDSVPSERLLVSNVPSGPGGKTRQRAWACTNFVSAGEWVVFADDNIREMTAVSEGFYEEPMLPVQDGDDWKDVFGSACSQDRFRRITEECIAYCDNIGARMCGFATNRNHYFRGRKWRHVGYVIGKLLLWRDCKYTFDDRVGNMDDFLDTAEHLWRFGVVGINNYVYPVAGHYEPGGHGTYSERKEARKRDVEFLMKQYPGLFRIKERAGFESGTELAIRFTSHKQVARWRRALPALRLQAKGIRVRG